MLRNILVSRLQTNQLFKQSCILANQAPKMTPPSQPLILKDEFSTTESLDRYYVQKTYLKRWGRRDMKRRDVHKEQEPIRTSLRALKKSDILPEVVKMKAAEDLAELPRNGMLARIRHRCTLTDRARGTIIKYRISRIKFRDYADKGLISGYTRSTW